MAYLGEAIDAHLVSALGDDPERLKGLAATFHGEELMALADDAIAGVPGDPALLRRIRDLLQEIDPTA